MSIAKCEFCHRGTTWANFNEVWAKVQWFVGQTCCHGALFWDISSYPKLQPFFDLFNFKLEYILFKSKICSNLFLVQTFLYTFQIISKVLKKTEYSIQNRNFHGAQKIMMSLQIPMIANLLCFSQILSKTSNIFYFYIIGSHNRTHRKSIKYLSNFNSNNFFL